MAAIASTWMLLCSSLLTKYAVLIYSQKAKADTAAMPAVHEVIRLIAQLGGFLGRKSNGEPGVKTIWRGFDQVMTAAQPLKALREEGG